MIMRKQQFLLSLLLSLALSVSAERAEIDGLWYDMSETTAEVIQYNIIKYSDDIVIPDTVRYNNTDYCVTGIGDYAFQKCSDLTSITIPSSITYIGRYAFMDCSGLTSITIPSSITHIGWYAFRGCNSLTAIVVGEENTKYDSRNNCNAIIETSSNTLITGCINTTIPNSVTSIEDDAFSKCTGLTSITIPNGVTTIGKNAFYGCTGLTSITIPKSATNIGRYAFRGCTSLTSISIPRSMTSIGIFAFFGCTGLSSITIPNSVTSIGEAALSNCSNLVAIVVEDGNTKYDSRNNCNALIETSSNTLVAGCKSSTIPNSVTSIGGYAFYYCEGLTFITIPNSVTAIGRDAFYKCCNLSSITIPRSVTSIGNNAFFACSGLTAIVVEEGNTKYDSRNNCNAIIETSSNILIKGCRNTTIPNNLTTIGDHAFSGCSLTSITIPNSVTSIGNNAFYACSRLSFITIGNSVTSIGGYAFSDCTGLTDVYCYAETLPTISSSAFYDTFIRNISLHVPASSIDTYKKTEPWSQFKEVVALTDDNPNPTGIKTIGFLKNDERSVYDLNGHRLFAPKNGINIIKTNDGRAKKVIAK